MQKDKTVSGGCSNFACSEIPLERAALGCVYRCESCSNQSSKPSPCFLEAGVALFMLKGKYDLGF